MRLTGERRIGGADTFSLLAMARGTGGQTASTISLMIEAGGHTARRRPDRADRGRHVRIVGSHCPPFATVELAGDIAHLRVAAPPVRISDHLPLQVAGVDPREPRRERSVAFAGEAVAGEAGVLGAPARTAKRDELAGRGQALGRIHRRGRAARGSEHAQEKKEPRHLAKGTGAPRCRFRSCLPGRQRAGELLPRYRLIVLLVLASSACKPPPEAETSASLASAERGRLAIERAGCAACHTIEGIAWPEGKTAPALAGLDRRGLIAGKLSARPDVLAAFVRDAPSLVPGTAMPAMPLTQAEALDVAAFLYANGS